MEGLKIFTKVNEEHPESLLWICQSGIWDLGHGKEGQLRDQIWNYSPYPGCTPVTSSYLVLSTYLLYDWMMNEELLKE